MKDHLIIEQLKSQQGVRAFRRLYAYFGAVKKYVKSNSGTAQDAEDVFQDALFILYKKVNDSDFKLTSSIESYLFGIAKNLWHERLRKKVQDQTAFLESTNYNSNDAAEIEFKSSIAEKAILLITEQCKQILDLFYLKRRSMDEIASILSYSSVNAAKTAKYKCLEKAKIEFENLLNTEKK